ncbi:hypothetical protein E2C01_067042 [Portunus trituberculatus]|uniref:Uncharacterized protein n=1 Tax=Portunus trituberculatus TaxID=210409 RepID=A0A5B7HIS3_PORTR|nr:hypothetical protein [Portunus trituberculatus]
MRIYVRSSRCTQGIRGAYEEIGHPSTSTTCRCPYDTFMWYASTGMWHGVPAQHNEQHGEYLPCTYLTTTPPKESVAAAFSESQQRTPAHHERLRAHQRGLDAQNILAHMKTLIPRQHTSKHIMRIVTRTETTNMLTQHTHADKHTDKTLSTAGSDGVVRGGLSHRQAVRELLTYGPRTAFICLVLRGVHSSGNILIA